MLFLKLLVIINITREWYLGYSVSILIDLEKLPQNWQELVKKAGLLKRNCFAAVFEKYFTFLETEQTGHKQAVIHYRDDETMYVIIAFLLIMLLLLHFIQFSCLLQARVFVFCFRYVAAQKDRVTVIFSTVFKSDEDIIIGKLFMQVGVAVSC